VSASHTRVVQKTYLGKYIVCQWSLVTNAAKTLT
jgi:hypothetical protein